MYIFGALLVFTAIKLLRSHGVQADPQRNPLVRLTKRFFPVASDYSGSAFTVRRAGRRLLTPLAVALVAVESADLVFAVDSVPAVLAVSDDTFVVFTSNVAAILGLRSLYFALAGSLQRFEYLSWGLGRGARLRRREDAARRSHPHPHLHVAHGDRHRRRRLDRRLPVAHAGPGQAGASRRLRLRGGGSVMEGAIDVLQSALEIDAVLEQAVTRPVQLRRRSIVLRFMGSPPWQVEVQDAVSGAVRNAAGGDDHELPPPARAHACVITRGDGFESGTSSIPGGGERPYGELRFACAP